MPRTILREACDYCDKEYETPIKHKVTGRATACEVSHKLHALSGYRMPLHVVDYLLNNDLLYEYQVNELIAEQQITDEHIRLTIKGKPTETIEDASGPPIALYQGKPTEPIEDVLGPPIETATIKPEDI